MKRETIFLKELDYLKIIGVFLVVLGHCTAIYTGGWVFTSPVNSLIYSLLSSYVYTFHVPMLVFVSGSIYYYCRVKKEKYIKLKDLVINKFKRLIVPFLFIGIFYAIPIKYIIGLIDKNILKNIQFFLLGLNTGHLWYLLMLFDIFIFFYLYEKFILKKRYSIILNLIVFILLYIYSNKFINIFLINRAIQYSVFFYFGYEFFRSKDIISSKLEKLKTKNLIITIPLLVVVSLILILISKIQISNSIIVRVFSIINIVIAMLSILACYLVVYLINNRLNNIIIRLNIDKLIYISRKYSLNIYLLHEPIIFIILHFISQKNINPNILVIGCLIICIVVSILFSIMYSKIKSILNIKIKWLM